MADNSASTENPSTSEESPKKKRGAKFIWIPSLLLGVLPLWFFFLGPNLRHDRLLEKGVRVPGRLLMVEETGTVVNNSPELELTIEFTRKDGVLDTAVTDFVPGLRWIHLFQPGRRIIAAYDPEDPEEITLADMETPSTEMPDAQAAVGQKVDSLQRLADSLAHELQKRQSQQ